VRSLGESIGQRSNTRLRIAVAVIGGTMTKLTRLLLALATFTLLPTAACGNPGPEPAAVDHAAADWNDAGVNWRTYEAGIAEAKATNKAIFLVFYTTWCPHCHNVSWRFHNETVVELSQSYVMVRVDKDANEELSNTHAPDGAYIPRVYVLDSKGNIKADVKARPSGEYSYFPDEYFSNNLIDVMKQGLKK
jgi:thiol-disulfide isomerase/thioredoxin